MIDKLVVGICGVALFLTVLGAIMFIPYLFLAVFLGLH